MIGLKGGKGAVVEDGRGDKKLVWVVDRSGGNGQGLAAATVGLEKLNPATDSAPAAAALQEGNAAPALPSDENNPDMEPVGLLALRIFLPLITVDGVVGMVLLFLEPKWKLPLNWKDSDVVNATAADGVAFTFAAAVVIVAVDVFSRFSCYTKIHL